MPDIQIIQPPPNALPGDGGADFEGDVDALVTMRPRPSFNISVEQRSDIRNAASEVLIARNEETDPPLLYNRGGSVAKIDDSRIEMLQTIDMLQELEDIAAWFSGTGKVPSASSPPSTLAQMLLRPGSFVRALPPLDSIANAPTFSVDGEFETEPGYHRASRSFYVPTPGLVIPAVSANPTADERTQARENIFDILRDFPFVNDHARANAIAMLMLGFIRPMLEGEDAPMHVFDAPVAGTGKGRLANVLSIIITGNTLPVTPEAENEAEWRKKIFAMMLESRPILAFDNLNARLSSETLCTLLTGGGLTDRILGQSKMSYVKTQSILVGTGNNVTVSDEIVRRTVRTRIAYEGGSPLGRTGFKYPNLLGYVRENRGELIWSVATLVRAWIADGRPKSGFRKDSFETWSEIMGGILATAGIQGLAYIDPSWSQSKADPETGALDRFVMGWWSWFKDQPVKVAQLFDKGLGVDLSLSITGQRTEFTVKRALGIFVQKRRDRWIGEYCIRDTDINTDGVTWWRLERRPQA
jgi:putative DNA primase/helicase